jgi:hypothetical protein
MLRRQPHPMSAGERYQQIIPRLQRQQYLPIQTIDTLSISKNILRLRRRQIKHYRRPMLELPPHRRSLRRLRLLRRHIRRFPVLRRLTRRRLDLRAHHRIRPRLFIRRSHHTVHRPRPARQPALQATLRQHTVLQPLQRPLTRHNPVHRSQPAP